MLKQSNAQQRWFGNQNLSVSEEDSGRQWNKRGFEGTNFQRETRAIPCLSKGWSFYRALVGPKRTIPCRWHAISAAPIHFPELHLLSQEHSWATGVYYMYLKNNIRIYIICHYILYIHILLHKFVHSPSLQSCWQILLSLRATQYVQTNIAAKHPKTCGPSRAPCWNLSNWKVDKTVNPLAHRPLKPTQMALKGGCLLSLWGPVKAQ